MHARHSSRALKNVTLHSHDEWRNIANLPTSLPFLPPRKCLIASTCSYQVREKLERWGISLWKYVTACRLNSNEYAYHRIVIACVSRAKCERVSDNKFSLFILATELDSRSLPRWAQVRQYWTWLRWLLVVEWSTLTRIEINYIITST